MLDIDLQKHLDQAKPLIERKKTKLTKLQISAVFCVVSLCSAAIGISSYAALTAPLALPADDLGKLAVIVSNDTDTVPVDIWAAMERHIGKRSDEFNAKDQMKAIGFLLHLIEQHPKDTINIW